MIDLEARKSFHERCFKLGVDILRLGDDIPKDVKGKHMAGQVVRAGTSIGANLQEAQAAQSRADFIHKMQLSLKEARETTYWLSLLKADLPARQPSIDPLIKETQEIASMLAGSILTAKRNARCIA